MNFLSAGLWHVEGAPQLFVLLFFFFQWKGKEVGNKNGVCAEVEQGEEGSLLVCRELIPKGQISQKFPFWLGVSVFSCVDSELEEIKGEMCNSVGSVAPWQGYLFPERLQSLMACSWCFHANRYCFYDCFPFSYYNQRFQLQITLPLFLPSLPEAPQITLLMYCASFSDYRKAFDKIHCLLKKKIKSFLLYFAC